MSIEFQTQHAAARFEGYLKSGSGRAFAKRHFVSRWRWPRIGDTRWICSRNVTTSFEWRRRTAARNLRVFGFVARGDDRAHEDVDLLVDMDVDGSLVDIVGLVGILKSWLTAESTMLTATANRNRTTVHPP